MKILLILTLLISSVFSNSMFNATFLGNDEIVEQKSSKFNEYDPVYIDYSASKESVERQLSNITSCIKGNCPLNAVQCKEDIIYDKGIAKEHKSFLTASPVLKNGKKVCPDGFIGNGPNVRECKMYYSYYTYSCPSGWNGTLESTGGDCEGIDLINGKCNSETPPDNNCFKENYSCPFEGGECSIMKDKEKPLSVEKDIYTENLFKLEKKEIKLDKQNGKCPDGSINKNGNCMKSYYVNIYSCPNGYDLLKNEEDCLGFCGDNGCICNPSKIENACVKKYEKNSFSALEIKESKDINFISIDGEFGDYTSFYGFSSIHNKIEFVHAIYSDENKLCFKSSVNESCFEFSNCSFEGNINGIIKNISVDKKSIIANGQIITSTCDIYGHVGNFNLETGITGIYTEKDKLKFYDAFLEKDIGDLTFREPIEPGYEVDGLILKDFYASIFYEGDTYFISQKECNSDKTPEELNLKNFGNYKCIIKKTGNHTIDNISKIKKTIGIEGYDVYKCSPISCENGACQTATCPEGYDGNIFSIGEFIEDFECRDKVCDAKKPYSLYCGIKSECNESKSDVLKIKGECKQATCSKGEFNKDKRKCIEYLPEE